MNIPYANSGKKSLCNTSIPPNQLKHKIDSILHNDYQLIKKNHQKQISIENLQSRHNNQLIMEYVKTIYEEYHLPDPLEQPLINQQITQNYQSSSKKKKFITLYSSKMTNSSNQTVKKRVAQYSNNLELDQSHSPQRRGNKIKIKTSLKQQNITRYETDERYESIIEDINRSTDLNVNQSLTVKKSLKYFQNSPSHNEQKVDETSNLIGQFKRLIVEQQQQLPEIEKSSNSSPLLAKTNKLKEQFLKVIQKPLPMIVQDNVADQLIKQSFRYCIGCQKALLEANIDVHEKVCFKFKKMFQMTPNQLVQELKIKIDSFQRTVKQYSEELLGTDKIDLSESSALILQKSRLICKQGVITRQFQYQYQKVMQISKKWCLITQEINKINWFLKIRQRLKRQFDL